MQLPSCLVIDANVYPFPGWKRLLLADGPRQAINALTLYAFYLSKRDDGAWYDIGKYFAGNDFETSALTVTTAFTTLVFAGSLLVLVVAGVCYIPLLCHIQGNLKEYCCHKVDKVLTTIHIVDINSHSLYSVSPRSSSVVTSNALPKLPPWPRRKPLATTLISRTRRASLLRSRFGNPRYPTSRSTTTSTMLLLRAPRRMHQVH